MERLRVDVVVERSALVQVIVNLLSNAWKYTGANKEIHCSATTSGDKEVEIIVKDNGPGIPGSEHNNLFEKFWRGQDAVESGIAGSGLGLAIVHGIVKVHRGRIDFHCPSGGGTSFRVYLPRGKPA